MADMIREVVPALAESIETRRKQLGLAPGDLINATGVTGPGLAPLRRGERRAYQERLTMAVCRALRWTPDSIDLLLAGEEPVTWEDELRELEHRLAESAFEVEQSGGSEEVREYVWNKERVNEARARLGMEAHLGFVGAEPHVRVRELIREATLSAAVPSPTIDQPINSPITRPDELAELRYRVAELEHQVGRLLRDAVKDAETAPSAQRQATGDAP